MYRIYPFISIFLLLLILGACFSEPTKLAELEAYEGPSIESEDVRILVSDSAVNKILIIGARQLKHQNGDLEFPEGMEATIYNSLGEPITKLTALRAYQNSGENIYRAVGDVFVTNLQKNETLRTEELFWDPEKEIIYTEKFVTIKTEDDLIPGEGLIAPQDFSTFEIKKPTEAVFKLEENNEDF
jgi:lipopolysaccharide export system protein LptC